MVNERDGGILVISLIKGRALSCSPLNNILYSLSPLRNHLGEIGV